MKSKQPSIKKKPPFYTEIVSWIDGDYGIESKTTRIVYFNDLDEAIKLADSINDPKKDATVFETTTEEELYFHYTNQ